MSHHDAPEGYFEIDFPSNRLRLTHYPSGDTALRHDYMFDGEGAEKWSAKLRELTDAHPGAHGIHNSRGKLVADIRDYPALGGGFSVGDLVVTRTEDGFDVARGIVSSFQNGAPEYRGPGEPAEAFRLEDGHTLYFSTSDGGWMATCSHGDRERARRVLPGDDLDAIREAAPAMLARSARRVAHDLNQNRDLHAAAVSLIDEGALPAVTKDRWLALREHLHNTWVSLAATPDDRKAYTLGVGAISEAKAFVMDVRDAHAERHPDDPARRAWLSRELPSIEALAEGLRLRDPSYEPPATTKDDEFAPAFG